MIVKHVPMKSAKKSDFSGLVKYITGPQGKQERVGLVRITNCQSEQAEIAMLEVLNIQAQNTRSIADKTYHLVVGFPAGEIPDVATLNAIEQRLSSALGFQDHQRISVVHQDTDNLHVHIAINKIHPTRYTIQEPYNAYHIIGTLCDELEVEFGLQRVNHRPGKGGSENRTDDMERHTAVESLLGWIKRECAQQIQEATSWSALHRVMLENGLRIHERANGLVITSDEGTSVKASSVHRELSKAKLEQRLGAFEPSSISIEKGKPTKRYDKRPMRSRVNTLELYARYKSAQQLATSSREVEWSKTRNRKNRLIENAKRAGRLKRAAIKLTQAPRIAKKIMYAATSQTLRDDIAVINRQYMKERREIYQKYQRHAWADWLQSEAIAGDQQALAALRARQGATNLTGNTVTGKRRSNGQAAGARLDSVTKKGTIIYSVGKSAVRDDGDKLMVSRGADQAGLIAALRMATDRYGNCITVNGSVAFKEQIVQAAIAANLLISFDDVALERRRQQLANTAPNMTNKENKHGNNSNDINAVRRQPDRGSDGSGKQSAARNWRNATDPQPDTRSTRQAAPPKARHGMRGLSELGVVHVSHGSEVLLPGHVPGHVERQGTQPDHGVRRGLRGLRDLKAATAAPPATSAWASAHGRGMPQSESLRSKPKVPRAGSAPPPASQDRLRHLSQLGAVTIATSRSDSATTAPLPMAPLTTPAITVTAAKTIPREVNSSAIAAAEKYVIEREQKRCNGFDIPKHKRFTLIADVTADYGGTRVIDGHTLALLKVVDEVMVLPVDDATARRLKRLPLGRPLEVNTKGIIKSKGRFR